MRARVRVGEVELLKEAAMADGAGDLGVGGWGEGDGAVALVAEVTLRDGGAARGSGGRHGQRWRGEKDGRRGRGFCEASAAGN